MIDVILERSKYDSCELILLALFPREKLQALTAALIRTDMKVVCWADCVFDWGPDAKYTPPKFANALEEEARNKEDVATEWDKEGDPLAYYASENRKEAAILRRLATLLRETAALEGEK